SNTHASDNVHAYASIYADANANTDANTDAHADTYAHANTNSYTRRMLSQLRDSGRVRCASFSHYRLWRYRARLACALRRYHRKLQYRCWRRSAGAKQHGFKYCGRRSSLVAPRQGDTKHGRWN